MAVAAAAAFLFPAFAAGSDAGFDTDAEKAVHEKTDVKKAVAEAKNHFSFYGFIRNYFAYDTRESVSGTGDLFYYLPKDESLNELGEDLNAKSSFRFLSITSRLGVDVSGYRIGNTSFGAKVETDFYAMSGTTAILRLRQAYMTIGWKDLPLSGRDKASVTLKIGQAWHPLAADLPDVISLASGCPFNPFSRTPQVTMDAALGNHFTLTGSILYQMQYTSAGPAGSSADYMKYGIIPEFYAGLSFRSGGFLARAGVDILSIKPRWKGTSVTGLTTATVKVSDRITTMSPFVYLQYVKGKFALKAKSVYGSAGEHINLMSGYGVTGMFDDGHWEYAPLHSTSSWMTLSYGKKVQGVLMVGYMKNLGTSQDLLNTSGSVNPDYIFFNKNGFANLNSMYRIVPTIIYNVGKFSLGLEYEMTSAQYGDGKTYNASGLSADGLHRVTNHRLQMMVKFTF